jgi:hypothetical protein
MAILIQHVQDAPPNIDDRKKPGTQLVEGIDRVVGKCLAKAPEDRYQSMSELAADLERLQAGLAPEAIVAPVPSMAPGSPDAARPSAARGAYVVAALGVVVSAALGYALYIKKDVIQVVETVAAPPPSVPAPSAASSAAPTPPAEAERTGRDVMVIVFPADARISRGREDLGKMPVTVNVPEGETVTLSIRHSGFASRRLKLDGKRSRIVVGLVRLKKGKKHAASAEAEAEAEAQADKVAAERAADMPHAAPTGETKATAPESPPKETEEPAKVPAKTAPTATVKPDYSDLPGFAPPAPDPPKVSDEAAPAASSPTE